MQGVGIDAACRRDGEWMLLAACDMRQCWPMACAGRAADFCVCAQCSSSLASCHALVQLHCALALDAFVKPFHFTA